MAALRAAVMSGLRRAQQQVIGGLQAQSLMDIYGGEGRRQLAELKSYKELSFKEGLQREIDGWLEDIK